jgi:type II secretory pathway pseudopilin PulG
MRRLRAFTLIEIVFAIAILILVLVLAVPSLTGVLADRRLRHSLDTFNDLVHQAQERSLVEHRNYLITWNEKAIQVRPEVFQKGEEAKAIAQFQIRGTDNLKVTFPAALIKSPPAEWIFWPSGICEPAIVQFASRDGVWTADYSGLSAQPELTKYVAR